MSNSLCDVVFVVETPTFSLYYVCVYVCIYVHKHVYIYGYTYMYMCVIYIQSMCM